MSALSPHISRLVIASWKHTNHAHICTHNTSVARRKKQWNPREVCPLCKTRIVTYPQRRPCRRRYLNRKKNRRVSFRRGVFFCRGEKEGTRRGNPNICLRARRGYVCGRIAKNPIDRELGAKKQRRAWCDSVQIWSAHYTLEDVPRQLDVVGTDCNTLFFALTMFSFCSFVRRMTDTRSSEATKDNHPNNRSKILLLLR